MVTAKLAKRTNREQLALQDKLEKTIAEHTPEEKEWVLDAAYSGSRTVTTTSIA